MARHPRGPLRISAQKDPHKKVAYFREELPLYPLYEQFKRDYASLGEKSENPSTQEA